MAVLLITQMISARLGVTEFFVSSEMLKIEIDYIYIRAQRKPVNGAHKLLHSVRIVKNYFFFKTF